MRLLEFKILIIPACIWFQLNNIVLLYYREPHISKLLEFIYLYIFENSSIFKWV